MLVATSHVTRSRRDQREGTYVSTTRKGQYTVVGAACWSSGYTLNTPRGAKSCSLRMRQDELPLPCLQVPCTGGDFVSGEHLDHSASSNVSSNDSENASLPCDADDYTVRDDTQEGSDGNVLPKNVGGATSPEPPFNGRDAFAHWLLANNISQKAIKALFDILFHHAFELSQLTGWKSARDVQQYVESRAPDKHRGWRRKTVRAGNKAWLEYWYCDGLVALQDLLKDPKLAPKMSMEARVVKDGVMRVFSTPETALWWEELQRKIDEVNPEGVVAALILASDETHMDQRGKAKGHPVYLTLGNIDKDDRWKPYGHVLLALLPEYPAEYDSLDRTQVFHYIMNEVVAGLKRASHTGIDMVDSTGKTINVWHVTDYPESCKVTCTKSGSTNFPCSLCKVHKDKLALFTDRIQARTPSEQRSIVHSVRTNTIQPDHDEAISTHPVQSYLWGWRWEAESLLNPYLAVLPVIMHQADLGLFEHIVDSIRAHIREHYPRKMKLLDQRLKQLRKSTRGGCMRLPSGEYFAKDGSFGFVHRVVLGVRTCKRAHRWQSARLEDQGSPDALRFDYTFPADIELKLHQDASRQPLHRYDTAFGLARPLLCTTLRAFAHRSIAPMLAKKKTYDTAMIKAQRTGVRVLSRRSWLLHVPRGRTVAPFCVPNAAQPKRDEKLEKEIRADLAHLRSALDAAPACNNKGENIQSIQAVVG
ncbi:unnamed protein product [Closterium sp. Yama58-4]|nr:unnamed protein product [Closterium sp. Yama58-4]